MSLRLSKFKDFPHILYPYNVACVSLCCCLALPIRSFAFFDCNAKLPTQTQSPITYLVYVSYIYTCLYFFFFYFYLLFLVGTSSTQFSIIFSPAFVPNSNSNQRKFSKFLSQMQWHSFLPRTIRSSPFSHVTWRYCQS